VLFEHQPLQEYLYFIDKCNTGFLILDMCSSMSYWIGQMLIFLLLRTETGIMVLDTNQPNLCLQNIAVGNSIANCFQWPISEILVEVI